MVSADDNTVTIVLPLIVHKVQMTPAEKLALGAIFSVVLITFARSILRSIESFREGASADSSPYTYLELARPIHRGLPRGQTKHTPRAFAPLDIGDTEQQGSRSTSVTVCCSDRRPQGYLRTYLAPID
ncbi:hypothetical protein XPA_009257 [Xanthoria parietina]